MEKVFYDFKLNLFKITDYENDKLYLGIMLVIKN